jgi:hypothetical protein
MMAGLQILIPKNGGWQLAAGNWLLATSSWRPASGGWQCSNKLLLLKFNFLSK